MPRRALLALMLGALGAVADAASAQVVRDVNCDGAVDAADRPALVQALFAPDAPPCASADVNRDGQFSAADLIAFAVGPRISYIGIASADGRPAPPLGMLEDGATVYFRNAGFGFLLVVEAAPPPDGAAIGTTTFDSAPRDARHRPDFQIVVDRPLGDGSRAVCDEFGVPAVASTDFAVTQAVSDSINDLACRFYVATAGNGTCTQDALGQPGFIAPNSRAQFCLPVTGQMAFPSGDTRVSVQIRDRSGLVGPLSQMVLRIENGPMPPTFTPLPPTPTRTATPTPSSSPTPSLTPTASATRTATPTRTRTQTATRTATSPFTPTLQPSPTATITRTPTGSTRTPSRTATGATPTRTTTATASAATPTRTRSGTPTVTRPPTPTATRGSTASPTPTVTANASGPVITFFGLKGVNDFLIQPTVPGDIPIYQQQFGFNFSLVVEARPGASHTQVGNSTFNQGGAPDLQIQVTNPLGDGSDAVCDDTPPDMLGGVPAINPPTFSNDPTVIDRLNDLGCRFIDGSGLKIGRACDPTTACVLGGDGLSGCVGDGTTVQFCGYIAKTVLAFPSGDTLVTARVRDARGFLGPPEQLIVRVP